MNFDATVAAAIGIVCIVIGIFNTKGKINSLHEYHRKNVREEDRVPFGRLVGAGTITVGCGVIAYAVMSVIASISGNSAYITVGTVVMTVGIVAGLAVSFYGMKKYNGGMF